VNSRVTQRDIAREAGVSHVTVSLALRDSPSIPVATRNTIKEISLRLGYSPDPMLTALSSYRAQQRPATHQANIGWLYTDKYLPGKGWGDFHHYYEGAKARANELGYILDEINIAGEYADPKRLRRLLEARNITGLVLSPCSTDPAVAHDFDFDLARFCAVRVGYSYRSPLLNTVANAQFRTVLTAMREVIALGYERIGTILTHVLDERTSWQFLGAYLAGGHFLSRKNWIEPLYVPHHGRDWLPDFFRWVEKQRIDCFVGPGYGFLCPMLKERGYKIPEDIGFADTQLQDGDLINSGVNQNAHQIGVSAVELLVSMMHRHQVGVPKIASHMLVEGSWQENQTTSRRVPATARPSLVST
jgi:DNA-binding LacI/PurR family transcriptional regulator